MKKHAFIMGMPVVVSLSDTQAAESHIEELFSYFHFIDNVFSTYKPTSEISRINTGMLSQSDYSDEMKIVLRLCEETKKETNGYFDIHRDGKIDPLGIVKGYAIFHAANMLRKKGFHNFYIEIAGDIEIAGKNEEGKPWRVGIENPFNRQEIIKVVELENKGIATSGNYIRGKHIYNPITRKFADDIMSTSVIGPNVYDADRFATAAFAMGEQGIYFIESLPGFEGYMIKQNKQAIYTSGFQQFIV